MSVYPTMQRPDADILYWKRFGDGSLALFLTSGEYLVGFNPKRMRERPCAAERWFSNGGGNYLARMRKFYQKRQPIYFNGGMTL